MINPCINCRYKQGCGKSEFPRHNHYCPINLFWISHNNQMLCFDSMENARDYVLWWDGYSHGYQDGLRNGKGNGMDYMQGYNEGWGDGWMTGLD